MRIDIRELGAIRNSSISTSPLMIFSGESGLGKSYAAFVVHYLYKLILENERMDDFFINLGCDYDKVIEGELPQQMIVSIDVFEEWINKDAASYLRETVGNPRLNVDLAFHLPKYKNAKLVFSIKKDVFQASEKEIVSYLFELEGYGFRIPDSTRKLGVLPWCSLMKDFLKNLVFSDDELEQTFMMAPGRGALLNVDFKSQDYAKTSAGMYKEFLKDWQIVKDMPESDSSDKELHKKLLEINGGRIVLTEDSVSVQMNDTLLPISSAASSVKELAPLAMLYDKNPAKSLSVLFEEPEAHLHPSKQIAMADFVVEALAKGSHMQITTHSDYFIRRINDRVMLHEIKDRDPGTFASITKELSIETAFTLDANLLHAYLLKRNDSGYVSIVSQPTKDGVPYDTFHHVLTGDFDDSMKINRAYKQLKDAQ